MTTLPRELAVDYPEPLLYTVEEAAWILRCTPAWLKAKTLAREIPYTDLGDGPLFTRKQVQEIRPVWEASPDDETTVPDVLGRFYAWALSQGAAPDASVQAAAFVEGFAQGLEWAGWDVDRLPREAS